jgi:hypothetical protein
MEVKKLGIKYFTSAQQNDKQMEYTLTVKDSLKKRKKKDESLNMQGRVFKRTQGLRLYYLSE